MVDRVTATEMFPFEIFLMLQSIVASAQEICESGANHLLSSILAERLNSLNKSIKE